MQGRQTGDEEIEQVLVELPFAGQRLIAGTENLVFERLDLRGDESFGRLDRLATLVVLGKTFVLRTVHLDVETLHAVEAEP